jgi:selenocysteine lyase/cysteine desulfurase
MTPRELRADTPALHEDVYLNFGTHGPSPRYVFEAANEFLQSHEYGLSARNDPYNVAFDAYDRARERVADFVGATPDEIALTESTTAGINAIANAVDWSPGNTVVRTDVEHPAGMLPWQRLEREGVEVRVVETEDGRIDLDDFATAVDDAELACFSAVTWTHGTQLPVAELVDIARTAGAPALVDAVQVPGQLPMDVSEWGADVVAAAGHKWLLGCGAAASSTSIAGAPTASIPPQWSIGASRRRRRIPTSSRPGPDGSKSGRRTRLQTSLWPRRLT